MFAGVFSAALHLVLILLYASGGFDLIPTIRMDTRDVETVDEFRGTRIINLQEIEDPAPASVAVPEPPIEEREAIPVPTEVVPEQPSGEDPENPESTPAEVVSEAADDPRSAAETLRIDGTDTDRNLELWKPVNPELVAISDNDLMLLLLAMDLEQWNDSISALIEAQRGATDWTFTDDEGRRWGIADGQLHLGDITIPLPFNFGTNPWMRDEQARRAFEDEAIRRGIESQAIRRTIQERAQVMRERIDRERRERRGGAPPDTGRVRN